jgi:hypothetical protein
MGLRLRSLLVCSINIRGGARGDIDTYTPPCENPSHHLLSVKPWNPSYAWGALAHPCAVLHLCTCGLCGGATAIVTVLISYDDVKVVAGTTTRRRWSWSTTFSTPICNYVGLLLQLFFCYTARLVVMIHDLILVNFITWHSRNSANVVYLYPFM